ncbi:hypothetical protein JYU14_02315 [Simkania negevensis]|uniref:Uncharacterized protein n=1 Tax=Simkania negevensis TaxID=83561 RepID=A0ABS3ARZ7_9BACT|nr:hypothetical protein [Simkania negevensis]
MPTMFIASTTLTTALLLSTTLCSTLDALPQVTFDYPKRWWYTTKETPLSNASIIVVGKSWQQSRPVINFVTTPYTCSDKEYLDNSLEEITIFPYTKDASYLGTMEVSSETVHLFSCDVENNEEETRYIQGILLKDGYAHHLTVSAAKEEFLKYIEVFNQAFLSLKVVRSR